MDFFIYIFFLFIMFSLFFLGIGIIHFIIFFYIYEYIYYKKSKSFANLKKSIQKYVEECNELNDYIEQLKNTPVGFDNTELGTSNYQDNSYYNYKRPMLKEIYFKNNVCNCSLTICDNARKQPLKYICKYFNMKESEKTLSMWESVLNNYLAVESGKKLLENKRIEIIENAKKNVPFLIQKLSGKFYKKIGLSDVNFKDVYFHKYVFNYVSAGGNASTKCEIIMDIENITKMIKYINQTLEHRSSSSYQRTLMTSKLRLDILTRDNFTCKYCGLSLSDEPHLLLEIDHILPISKGGKTTYSNLQTLCWKCNRKKSNKIIIDT